MRNRERDKEGERIKIIQNRYLTVNTYSFSLAHFHKPTLHIIINKSNIYLSYYYYFQRLQYLTCESQYLTNIIKRQQLSLSIFLK